MRLGKIAKKLVTFKSENKGIGTNVFVCNLALSGIGLKDAAQEKQR